MGLAWAKLKGLFSKLHTPPEAIFQYFIHLVQVPNYLGVRYTSLILLQLLLQLTQNIGVFVNSCLKPLANTHESYLQDTPYFLRDVEELNESGKIVISWLL